MDGVHQSAVDQILSAIKHGNLGVDETERRLQELIQAEQAKPSAERDQRLIDSAEQLREELYHRMALSFEAKRQKNLDSTVQKYKAWRRRQYKQKQALRISAFAAMLLLCLGLGSGLLHWNWFETKPSEDGEQYVIQGHEISLDSITQAIASHNGVDEIITTDTEALCAFLGFDPAIPEQIQPDLCISKFTAYIFPESIEVIAYYWSEKLNQNLSYNIYFVSNWNDATISIEQEPDSGKQLKVGNTNIYISKNYDILNAAWKTENTFRWVYGRVDEKSLLEIVNNILED